MKILIIDDEPGVVSMLVEWLSQRGHEAVGITGGKDAASWVKNKEFELVLLDVKLPDSDGLELIAAIVKAGARVVVMSGSPRESWVGQALLKGAMDCLDKPISLVHLRRILERLERSGR